MDDQGFLDFAISERMQMHMTNSHPILSKDEIAAALQLEVEYDHALESLPPKLASAIKSFHETIVDKLTRETVFYYEKGLKDGLLLYRTLQNL